jgi:hypothetical protein
MRVRTWSLRPTSSSIIPERKERLITQNAACDEANFIGLVEQETHRDSPAPIHVAFAMGALGVTAAWITLLLYGAWRFIDWIAA